MNTFDYFKQISQIPRESGNEAGIREFLLKWAAENNIKAVSDKVGNVVMYKEATKGYENVPPTALQGHMDMVCVKTPDSDHDFTKDPIKVYQDGDFLRAEKTSLGADNGIAIALIMDVFTDEESKHGPLEAIITVSEETGLTGAFNIDPSNISARKLINLDSEEEGVIFIGCAGGIGVTGTLNTKATPVPPNYKGISLNIDGLKGGHSGGEIHLQRLNAIKAMARILLDPINNDSVMLSSFNGGVRRNVIASTCEATILIPEINKENILNLIKTEYSKIKAEYSVEDPNFKLTIKEVETTSTAVNPDLTKKIVKSLILIPHGVQAMSKTIKGIVETSTNLAIANLENNQFFIATSQRSSVESARDFTAAKVALALEVCDFEAEIGDSYPSWTPNPDSPLAHFCSKAWEDKMGEKPEITAIHAGLECGIINSKIEGMDSVSIGPNMWGVHSTDEHLSISSTKKLSKFLKHLLEIIR